MNDIEPISEAEVKPLILSAFKEAGFDGIEDVDIRLCPRQIPNWRILRLRGNHDTDSVVKAVNHPLIKAMQERYALKP